MKIKQYKKIIFSVGWIVASIFFLLSLYSIHFVDKPLAVYIHQESLEQWKILTYCSEYGISFLVFICFILICFYPKHLKFSSRVLLFLYIVMMGSIGEGFRIGLGIICGRSWLLSLSGSGIYGSLISNNQFGFHFFQSSSWIGSFPSGHATLISIVCLTMAFLYPRFKFWWIIPIVIMVSCLILLNYHFLGDSLAGIALGVFLSYYGFIVLKGIIKI